MLAMCEESKIMERINIKKNATGHTKKLVLYTSIGMKFFRTAMACLACAWEMILPALGGLIWGWGSGEIEEN